MPQLYSLNGKLVSKEEYEKVLAPIRETKPVVSEPVENKETPLSAVTKKVSKKKSVAKKKTVKKSV